MTSPGLLAPGVQALRGRCEVRVHQFPHAYHADNDGLEAMAGQ